MLVIKASGTCPSGKNKIVYTFLSQPHKHLRHEIMKRNNSGKQPMVDCPLDAAPGGLLRVNRGTDANGLTDLLTFMSNAILKSSNQIFGILKP